MFRAARRQQGRGRYAVADGACQFGAISGKSLPVLIIGMVGASLFYGDAVITPAISVLSAVEGTKVMTPAFEPYVVPITLVILLALFAVQRFGTGSVGIVFGPIMLVWFLLLGASGLRHVFDDPGILHAINPIYGVRFPVSPAGYGLCSDRRGVPGRDRRRGALCGSRPFRPQADRACLAGHRVSVPAYQLCRAGRVCARAWRHVGHPFFEMNSGWMLIDGGAGDGCDRYRQPGGDFRAFSLTRQAVQLNLLPRFKILHTSETQSGQIYMPRVNFLLALIVMLLVVGFGESSSLAAAYGISVTGEMLMTTIPAVRRHDAHLWKWPLASLRYPHWAFRFIDVGFFLEYRQGVDGGWASLLVASDHVVWSCGPGCAAAGSCSTRRARTRFRSISWPRSCQEAAACWSGHRGVPDRRSAERADGADAQPQALQGAARAERHPVGDHRAEPTVPTARRVRWSRSTTCSCA
jgi:KUP system potassium uptake protein